MSKVKIGVLISGSGTNLQALIDACADPDFPAEIALVISNRKNAFGLERATQAGIPSVHLSHRAYDSREAFDAAIVANLRQFDVQWVCMAGFMRIVTPVLLNAFEHRVINIHPSLLPAFPGVDAQGQAFKEGVQIAGCTVHFVVPAVDAGPIIIQAGVPVLPGDDRDSLAARILAAEHQIFPTALKWAAEGRLRVHESGLEVNIPADQERYLFLGA